MKYNTEMEAILAGANPEEVEINDKRKSRKPKLDEEAVMEEAKRLYGKLAPILFDMGALEIIDEPTFNLMLIHYSVARQAAKEIKEKGLTDIDEQGVERKSPLLQILRDATTNYRQLAKQFPMSTKIRKQLDMEHYFLKEIEEDKDPFSDL